MLRAFSWYWSSSVKMNGAGIRLASQARRAIEPATTTATHAHAGARRKLSTKLDLGQAPRELRRLRRAGLDPDIRGSRRDVAQDRVGDGLASRRLLEGGDIEVGDAAEVVLTADEVERGLAHALPQRFVAREQLE